MSGSSKSVPAVAAAVAAVLALAAADLAYRRSDGRTDRVLPVGSRSGDVSYGRADAPFDILALVSLTCAHCAAWERSEMPAVLDGIVASGRARLVLRALPGDGQALAGAALVSCLSAPERAAAHAALMQRQGEWVGRAPAAAAAAAGLSGPRAAEAVRCAGTDAARAGVLEGAGAAASAWGARATPTFVVGRRVLTGSLRAEKLSAMLDEASAER